MRDTDILLSGDKWTIVVNIALDDYSALVDSVRSMLSHIRQKVLVCDENVCVVPPTFSFCVGRVLCSTMSAAEEFVFVCFY